jgi:hypothetical protein
MIEIYCEKVSLETKSSTNKEIMILFYPWIFFRQLDTICGYLLSIHF